MSSFYSGKLFKFKYVIFLLTFALLIISKKNDLKFFFFLFFDLCYETGGPDVGKSRLLNRSVNNNSHDTETFREGKKRLTMSIKMIE